jgi:hypothetical protein
MVVAPSIPKRKAIVEGSSRRVFSAYKAKRVNKKALVKEKEKRRYVRISRFRDTTIAFRALNRLGLSSAEILGRGLLLYIRKKGAKLRSGKSAKN